ncbi:MAG TPA: PEP/pyruvate-binding domain-containing protein [Planctomycetaceae bacterium]|nr:PEP/pyruvate-binding domain-containing protein [Planctomycetaceae bacterium]
MSPLFGTKAETLERLAPVLTAARVLPQFRLTVREWHRDHAELMVRMEQAGWCDRAVIVRSSALHEDGVMESLAGQFTSVPHVRGLGEIVTAIDRVIASYETTNDADQVFLQPQLAPITVSGVAFGLDPITGGPYIVINQQQSAQAGEVTGGIACDDELFYWLKDSPRPTEPQLTAVITLMDELERLLETAALDVEFAWAAETLYLLQVRPLTRVERLSRTAAECHEQLAQIAAFLTERQTAHRQVCGAGSVWGVMPDWNPAEMIGLRPRPLAVALYRECLTDGTWAEQRRRYGYRDCTGVPLMECLGGQAMIDVRASFTSFVLASVSDTLADKIVQLALQGLQSRPEWHDKVETELLFHCWTFDLDERLQHTEFTPEECTELSQALQRLTQDVMRFDGGPWCEDRRRMTEFEAWISSPRSTTPAALKNLLQRCRTEAGLAFAGLARAGFIAVCIVNSLIKVGVWTDTDRDDFFRDTHTVLTNLHTDRVRLSTQEFLARYGHLRPGTYDILVPRYDEAPELYLQHFPSDDLSSGSPRPGNDLHRPALSSLLSQHEWPFGVDEFLRWLREAIEWREYGKFVYSRGISELLRGLGEYAATLGISREDCSYATQSLWDESIPDSEFPEQLRAAIAAGRAMMKANRGLVLPPLLFSTKDLTSFCYPRCQPNFVTHNVGCGPVVEFDRYDGVRELRGAVVLLPSADPGYDWIFSAGIAAFVTKFGGANSHMAIRAREWNLPAAIGVGEVRYRRLLQARALRVDGRQQLLVTLP